MQTINSRMTETQMADLFNLTVQLRVKVEESNDRDTAVLAYSIQNTCSNLTESQREFRAADTTIHNLELKLTDIAAQLANAESRYRELAAELSVVDRIHNETVFIMDDRYERCSPEVQNMIRLLAVLQIPAYQVSLAEVRASVCSEDVNYTTNHLAAAFNNGFVDKPSTEVYDVVCMILDARGELANSTPSAADGISGEYAEKFLAEFSSQLRKGAAL